MKKLLLAFGVLSLLAFGDLSRDSSGIVTDSVTGLEWQDNYSDNATKIKVANWSDAIEYCETLTLDGGGWRVPNILELKSITNKNRYNPSIDSVFQNIKTSEYWSSTSDGAGKRYNGRFVHFYRGFDGVYAKSQNYYVRCVRNIK